MEAIRPEALPVAVGGEGPASPESLEVSALVERAKAGEAIAFDGLMLHYERRIISLGVQMGLSREDSLDACQEAFLKVFRYIGRFRSGEAFFKWLYRIAIHAIYDQFRKVRPAGFVSVEQMDSSEAVHLRDDRKNPEEVAQAADLAAKLVRGLDDLSRQERIVFILRDLQQVRTDEIGRILHLSQVTVRRHCMSARRKLRDRLLQKGH
jgi:RNA polymerase sigma-70 factor (ECF subfamily)